MAPAHAAATIANARMYSVSPAAAAAWRELFSAIIAASQAAMRVVDHAAPAPLEELWQRADLGAVFMCGLPFARRIHPVSAVAAPVPSPPEFGGLPCYWSEFVVRNDTAPLTLADTFGGRLALTVPESQSGCVAALTHFMACHAGRPLYAQIVAPAITPGGAVAAVAAGTADVAPIDAYALRLLEVHRPDLTSQVRRVARTATTPIPLLVASQPPPARLRDAVLEAHHDPALGAAFERLLLSRFVIPELGPYAALGAARDAAVQFWARQRLADEIHPTFAAAWNGGGPRP